MEWACSENIDGIVCTCVSKVWGDPEMQHKIYMYYGGAPYPLLILSIVSTISYLF